MSRITILLKTNEGGMWILPQIRAFVGRGHQVTTIIPEGDGRLRRALDAAGFSVMPTGFDFKFWPIPRLTAGLLRLRGEIRSTRPDALFYHLYATALATRLSTLGLGVPRVHMVAGPLYLESPWIRSAERVLRRLDSHTIAGSRYTARHYHRIGQPAAKLSVVPYGVDLDRFKPGADRRESLFGCSRDTFVAVMVAYVYAPKSAVFPGVGIKGHEVLLEAWRAFLVDHPNSLLVFIGGGFDVAGEAHRLALKALAIDFPSSSILWIDSVDDVRPYYASADVSVSPSISENHGAALEASAMAVPSIVSDAGGLPETVTPASGWIVAAGDSRALVGALARAAEARAGGRLAAMGSAARAVAEARFDVTRLAEDVVLRVESVVGERRHRLTLGRSADPRTRRSIVAFTEQRVIAEGGRMLGRSPLRIVEALAREAPVRLLARASLIEGEGTELAPSAVPVPLPWTSRGPLPTRIRMAIRCISTVVREVRRASVVYADQPGITGALGLAAARIFGRRTVVNVVGDARESLEKSVVPGIRGFIGRGLLPLVQASSAGHATVINYVTPSVLQHRYPPKNAREVFAISTAVPLGPAHPHPFPVAGHPARLITIGSLEVPYKGVLDLVGAIALLNDAGTPVRLTVVGEGRLRPDLERAAERTAPGMVEFLGHLGPEALHSALGEHDAFVLASWTEGLPRALVEAMADGLPCVATAVGGVPELLEGHRLARPRDPASIAGRVADLLSSQAAWGRTVEHNISVSAAVCERRRHMEGFVRAVTTLASEVTAR